MVKAPIKQKTRPAQAALNNSNKMMNDQAFIIGA